jgi:flavodoxin
METEKLIWRYGVKVVGVKKRCRKQEFHTTDKKELGEGVETPNEQDAKNKAKEWISKNMKSTVPGKVFATATAWTQDGDFENWQPFNENHNLKYPLEV